jgi:hypothetical protein
MDTKGLGNERWEAAEQEAVSESCKSRDESKIVGILDRYCEELGYKEYKGSDGQAPKSRCFQDFNKEVGSKACDV